MSRHDLPRAKQLLLLEFGSRDEFEDPSLEYRRLFSELLGTFLLVLAAAGGGLLHAKGQISLAAAEQTSGLVHINDSVGEIDRMTQQNSALVEESAAAAESLRMQASRLVQAVRQFTLEREPVAG